MTIINLKNKVSNIINTSDEKFLHLVIDLYDNYQKKNQSDFFNELPKEIQDLLIESKDQISKGNLRAHSNVISDFKEMYKTS